MESFALCLNEWGIVGAHTVPQRIDVALFTAASAAILHCYSDAQGVHRDVFRSKYLNVLDFILGSSGAKAVLISHVLALLLNSGTSDHLLLHVIAGVEAGKIRHVPSASDLMKQIMPEAVAKVRRSTLHACPRAACIALCCSSPGSIFRVRFVML